MQLLGARHPNVLGSTEVLQDRDFLYSVMPFCRDGDLFGVVVQYAEESGGDIGMPEPVARFWFRQILQVWIVRERLLWLWVLLLPRVRVGRGRGARRAGAA